MVVAQSHNLPRAHAHCTIFLTRLHSMSMWYTQTHAYCRSCPQISRNPAWWRRVVTCYATRAWEGRSASTGGSAATARTAAAAAFASTGGGAAGARTAATAAAPVIFLEATEVEEFDGVGRRSQMSGSPRCQHSWLVGREAVVSASVSVESLTHSRTSTRCRRPTEFLQTKNLSCPPKCQELL